MRIADPFALAGLVLLAAACSAEPPDNDWMKLDMEPGQPNSAEVLLGKSVPRLRLVDPKSHVAIEVVIAECLSTASSVTATQARYPAAYGSENDVTWRVLPDGAESLVAFPRAPEQAEVHHQVRLVAGVAGLRLFANTLEFLDTAGVPRLRVAPPSIEDAMGRLHPAFLEIEGCAVDRSATPPWGRPVTAPGAANCDVTVSWATDVPYPALLDPTWSSAGTMATGRSSHTGTLLSTGRVLVAGGYASTGATVLASAELYDPATKTWSPAGTMTTAREAHGAAQLPGGTVLVAGGFDASFNVLTSSETYNPAANAFTLAQPMTTGRADFTLTAMASGNVLAAGGYNTSTAYLAASEVYDASSGYWLATNPMATGRYFHTASPLPKGSVLVTGGYGTGGVLNSAELYNPALGTWSPAGTMSIARAFQAAAVLGNGDVLVSGGDSGAGGVTVDIYDPAAGWSSAAPMAQPRYFHTATTLSNGAVLVAGGEDYDSATRKLTYLNESELYDPLAKVWSPTASLAVPHASHVAVALDGGNVLISGGYPPDSGVIAEEFSLDGDGVACTSNSTCQSGFCVGGLCCNTACTESCGTCISTASKGTCTPLAKGSPGQKNACAPYVCSGSSIDCPVACTSNSACQSGDYCETSRCIAQVDAGAPCGAGDQCKTGFCFGAVCCDSACGPCGTCATGICLPIPAGTDGVPSCTPYVCDGTSVACPTSCAANSECEPDAGLACIGVACVVVAEPIHHHGSVVGWTCGWSDGLPTPALIVALGVFRRRRSRN
jgi:hypothetical protein